MAISGKKTTNHEWFCLSKCKVKHTQTQEGNLIEMFLSLVTEP